MEKRIGKRGAAPVIAIAIVFMFSVVIIEGIIFNNFIADIEVVKRTAREIAVINAVDAVEFAKKALKQAVSYSFYKSSKDVLAKGGFCAYDGIPCDEECKIPKDIRTFDCTPWWRIYNSTYAPSLSELTSYLSVRTSAIYDDYSSLFYGPGYCPEPPGAVTVEDTGAYSVYVGVTNTEGGVIEYESENLDIVEHTVTFKDTLEISTFEVFLVGERKFVVEDGVRNAFIKADGDMENECSEMETLCQNGDKVPIALECLEDVDPNGVLCHYDNKDTCKRMDFGGVCADEMPNMVELCEDYLEKYCCQEDDLDDCDINKDDKVDASERYRCKALDEIRNLENRDPSIEGVIDPSSYIALTSDIATGDLECLKADYRLHLLPEREDQVRISCNWENDADNTAPYDTQCCIRVKDEKCCGCKDRCYEECDHADCKIYDHGCPDGTELNADCDDEDCGYWSCTDRCVDDEVVGCTGDCSLEGGECVMDPGCDGSATVSGADKTLSFSSLRFNSGNGGLPPDNGDEPPPENGNGETPPDNGDEEPPPDNGDEEECSCDERTRCIEWSCIFSWVSKAQVCGYTDCKKTNAVVEDIRCVFDYVGTANVEVNVFDEENRYPISGWEKLNLPFYVVSGNVEEGECDGEVETGICCAAVTTEDTECKTS